MSRLNAIELFCGCGGASAGLEMAGFQMVGALDIDSVACETYARNFGLEPMLADIRRVSGREILDWFGLKKGDVDFLVGCPPCQGFSSLRRTTLESPEDFGRDDRNDLVSVFVDRVEEIGPSAVLFENVPGIATAKIGRLLKSPFLENYLKRMRKLGYKGAHDVVNATRYGVPQFRRRLIAFHVKCKRDELVFPKPTNSAFDEDEVGVDGALTVRGNIGDLPPLEAGEACPSIPNHRAKNHEERILNLIRSIPKDGGNRRDLPRKLWLDCHKRLEDGGAESVYGRMWWQRPAPTITSRCTTPSCGRFLHPEQDRAITPREAARLQTFSDASWFPETFNDAEWLIGNAVPPKLIDNLVRGFTRDNEDLLPW
nr:DNA cytosine methyltransferase [Candidatus Njordarchaeota archaeon]